MPQTQAQFKKIFHDLDWLDAEDFEIPLKTITIAKAFGMGIINSFATSEKYEGYQVFAVADKRVSKYFLDTPDVGIVNLAIEE